MIQEEGKGGAVLRGQGSSMGPLLRQVRGLAWAWLLVVMPWAVEEKVIRNIFPNGSNPTYPWHGPACQASLVFLLEL